ncbi:Por secretion system C-terminal sorting domain-containing protein [Chitinophaga sp. CF118]|uniref:T9SS-dependent choice-of-anchor J family protein n=1 Tax=Chitinophaga sp. CF118 TaxID=1884367 RepID=UPI0008EAE29F|nr:choice-of-anchor J domain-containing protein [Chitinophaga sp. CF118]SFD13199.1 Por secretion system C-terminal sorting domain-containing protein [Chitinophaga sp. CF118]
MKKTLLLFLAFTGLTNAYAQTQPPPQALPYQQHFDGLASTSTTYPDGWQGWTLSGSPSAAFNTATPSADKALATGSASSTTNGVYNYNGKLGFLNSGSADNCLALALNTSGQVNISVQYDVMTLRNPYDGTSNTRINEVILQYRIGSTGTFTNITGTEYQNTTTTQTTSGVTTPLDPATKTLVLPSDCNNQPLVQLRWVNRQISGAGSRPSFAVDNIVAGSSGADTTPPAISALLPENNSTGAAPSTQPAITFTENVQAGNGQLILHNVTTGVQQTFAVNSSSIIVSNATLTLIATLHPDQTYFITLDSAAVLDLSGNAFAGITDSTKWKFSIGAQQLNFDFNNCSGTLGGFTQYSVSGSQVWDCTTFGQNNTNGVQINGYSGGAVENEDWLISPAFDLTGFDYPLLGFASRTAFSGPTLQLLVSTDYSGTGNPHNATWVAVNGRFPQLLSDVWTPSDSINLAAFKQGSVHVAFRYTSSPALGAARWTIDDVHISNSVTAPLPTIDKSPASIDFDYVPAGQQSTSQPFTFQGNDFTGNLTLTASAGFLLAKDSSGSYSQTLNYTPSQADSLQTAWVKFLPTAANQAYSGNITFSTTGLNTTSIALSGTSLRSLKVVNWNIEWFGSPAQNPANDSLQQANVTTILKKLDADIFALAEVVDTARFRTVVSQLNGYSYILSDFGSYADSTTDVDYVSAQKLAFVYKTSVIRSLRSYGILRRGGSSTAYYNWSSGRFPFLMEAKANLNGDSALINFILIHGKANTGTSAEKLISWQRRKDGALELKDSLDVQYPASNFVVLGDFNDALDKTITTERAPDTTTSYIDFINDSLHYKPLTLPLSLAGQQSTVGYNTVIDNVLASDELAISYLPGSARVRKEVEKLVNAYSTTTTDHYPVQTNYNLHILGNPVPVSNFTAVTDSGNVKLTWQTPYEINVAYFVVERSRTQRNFEAVDTIAAHGTTTQPSDYLTYDTCPWLGLSYYRLKAVSKDGTVVYSNNQRVIITLRDIWKKLFWCIFGHQLQIWLDMGKYGPAQLQLVDLQGRIRHQSQIVLNKGMNLKTLDINNLQTGIYFLRVTTAEGSQVSKIFVSH